MKWKTSLGAMLLGLMFAAPVWAHHAAEGIISDDVWQMIDDNLTIVDSPHLTIEFDDIMNSMRVGEDPDDDGSLFLLSSITVLVEDVDDYMAVVEEVMNLILENPGDDSRIPDGITSSGKSRTLDWDLVDNQDGTVDIVLQEPIGGFDVEPDLAPTPPPGSAPQPKSKQGG